MVVDSRGGAAQCSSFPHPLHRVGPGPKLCFTTFVLFFPGLIAWMGMFHKLRWFSTRLETCMAPHPAAAAAIFRSARLVVRFSSFHRRWKAGSKRSCITFARLGRVKLVRTETRRIWLA